ncbi:MAG: class I SAM-dependent methyltransferase [Treponema sp.]|jgi:2-polyprenyl-3-methyl-5-hydroxy-6-metoxy-1,4-benzoquinol methylase|nr:class I SAM-dependent methyltransferase [Treponema sp.]
MGENCKICGVKMFEHDIALVLNKYNVAYYVCPKCGFIQTEEPYWLEEAYSRAIASADTGAIMRNISSANSLLFFMQFIDNNGRCLDFGGGHGILTRIMRDYGFDFYHYDKYAVNLYANGFEGNLEEKFVLITSFENFEHFVEPIKEIEKLLKQTEVLYFSTELIPKENTQSPPPPRIKDWWYYSPSTGQHISFYSKKTLEYIARVFDVNYMPVNNGTHIFSKRRINNKYFKGLKYYNKLMNLNISRFLKKKSKTMEDMYKVIAMSESKKNGT